MVSRMAVAVTHHEPARQTVNGHAPLSVPEEIQMNIVDYYLERKAISVLMILLSVPAPKTTADLELLLIPCQGHTLQPVQCTSHQILRCTLSYAQFSMVGAALSFHLREPAILQFAGFRLYRFRIYYPDRGESHRRSSLLHLSVRDDGNTQPGDICPHHR